MTNPNTAIVLDGAADLIEEEGWVQGMMVNENGRCLIGAINTATLALDAPGAAHIRAITAVEQEIGEPAMLWNDRPDRIKDDVVNVLRWAAKRERGG